MGVFPRLHHLTAIMHVCLSCDGWCVVSTAVGKDYRGCTTCTACVLRSKLLLEQVITVCTQWGGVMFCRPAADRLGPLARACFCLRHNDEPSMMSHTALYDVERAPYLHVLCLLLPVTRSENNDILAVRTHALCPRSATSQHRAPCAWASHASFPSFLVSGLC